MKDTHRPLRRTFHSTNGRVAWDRLGSGPPVVLMHGTPFSSYVWREFAEALSGEHTVHLWDMPGFGQSEMRAGQDVSLPGQQHVFTELLDHWGLLDTPPAVIAHDIGGAIALRTALLGGVRFDRLALIDVVALSPWGSPFFQLINQEAEAFEALPPHMHKGLIRSYIETASHRGLPPEVMGKLLEPWLTAEGQAAFYRQIAQADTRDTEEVERRLHELSSLPVSVMWGAEDSWIPPDRAEKLATLIPGAKVHFLRDSGHLVQEDAPARLAALLVTFLAGHGGER